MHYDQKATVSRSNVVSKLPLTTTGEQTGSTMQLSDRHEATPPRRSAASRWVQRLMELDQKMARDPAYRKKVIDQTS